MYDKKQRYREFSEKEKTMPIFSKGWWMDAVCRDSWDVILIEENNEIIGALPYCFTEYEGIKKIQKVVLTQNNGVLIKYPESLKYDTKLSHEKKIMNLIIDEIESLNINRYQQYFHYSITNWLPFYWRGYSQTTRYTYVIEDTSDLETLYNRFNSNVRKNLRKATKQLEVREDMGVEDFYHMNKMTFDRQGIEIPYSLELIRRVDNECSKRKVNKIYYCVDDNFNIHSAIYLVWDDESVYYLMSGSNPLYRSSQSLTLLIYEGIKLANRLGKKFDFEGSMKENIERFFRQFGPIQKPYHNIYKEFNTKNNNGMGINLSGEL
ncbi:conserved hypothetical protein [[Clostridium] ultunense Esp]|uniref:BioF2-like acetyltransferase domain-containing protein n=1 Tax=[Clostridium] ultunense Esp TaxID=1288971 RepID=M1ZH15_9FIRM|nr:hypothetical protein [Schnuerera ultunensis]CCQ97603.1 conserved hypothetical protein [[Clostridium] ultunense Esp]SHD77235.1 conserved protein of unknown function [[Clostridium] ultunense Esp]